VTHVVVIPRSGAEAALWRTTAEVAVLIRELPWVVVGGQMVMMLELEHGDRPAERRTQMTVQRLAEVSLSRAKLLDSSSPRRAGAGPGNSRR
jgi:hypothetical protein